MANHGHKTRKCAVKRFRVTPTGKVMRGKPFGNHLLTKKSATRKRSFRKQYEVTGPLAKDIRISIT